jgi:hypothetical protein
MPAWGVTDWFGVDNAPLGCVQESSLEITCEVATIRGDTGITTAAIDKPLRTGKVSIKCKGARDLVVVATGAQTSQIAVISSKYSESNDDFPTSEVEAVYYE